MALSATFCCHAIERSVHEKHVIDRFRAVPCLSPEAVKALVAVAIGSNNKDSAHVIVATVSGRA